jgi:hypothetical protein
MSIVGKVFGGASQQQDCSGFAPDSLLSRLPDRITQHQFGGKGTILMKYQRMETGENEGTYSGICDDAFIFYQSVKTSNEPSKNGLISGWSRAW